MKTMVLDAPYRFRLEERPLPALEPDWALVAVQAAGICGSDIHFYTGEIAPDPGLAYGHEIAGVVVEPGPARPASAATRNCATTCKPSAGSTRVALPSMWPCRPGISTRLTPTDSRSGTPPWLAARPWPSTP